MIVDMTNETSREGRKGDDLIIMPSSSFFKNLYREMSFSSLKLDVRKCIENREMFLHQLQEYTISMEQNCRYGTSDGEESSSRALLLKGLLFNVFNSSLCVVESIVLCDHFPLLDNDMDHNTEKYTMIPNEANIFLWKGANYLLKMFSDIQFACKLPDVMRILLPEKKSLYRNPFILPLNIDEIATFDPNATNAMLSRVPWNFDLKRLQRAASRLLSEERRISYGDDRHNLEIYSRDVYNSDGNRCVILHIPSPPEVDMLELNKVVKDGSQFHDLVVIYCVKLLTGAYASDDVSCLCDSLHIVTKRNMLSLVNKPLNGMVQKLTCMREQETLQKIETQILLSIYTMVGRYLLKSELITSPKLKPNDSINSLKQWIIGIVAKDSHKYSDESLKAIGNQIREQISDLTVNQLDEDSTGLTTLDETESLGNLPPKENGKGDGGRKFFFHDHELIDGEKVIPIPLYVLVNARKESNLLLIKGKIERILPGNVLRIGHPHYSHDYPISKIVESRDGQKIFLQRPFNYSGQVDASSSISAIDTAEMSLSNKINDGNMSRSLEGLRAWKLVPKYEDKRLGWRIQYDDGQVPWHHSYSDSSEYEIHFGVRLRLTDVEKQCYDSITDPNKCAHQQRLYYFEKVALLDIIVETYKCVCQWHPVTSSIDNVKWAKLARKMKFLSLIKNSNHEVDMAFFRRSQNRKLNLNQFKSVLEDMARLKYPTKKFGKNVCYSS